MSSNFNDVEFTKKDISLEQRPEVQELRERMAEHEKKDKTIVQDIAGEQVTWQMENEWNQEELAARAAEGGEHQLLAKSTDGKTTLEVAKKQFDGANFQLLDSNKPARIEVKITQPNMLSEVAIDAATGNVSIDAFDKVNRYSKSTLLGRTIASDITPEESKKLEASLEGLTREEQTKLLQDLGYTPNHAYAATKAIDEALKETFAGKFTKEEQIALLQAQEVLGRAIKSDASFDPAQSDAVIQAYQHLQTVAKTDPGRGR